MGREGRKGSRVVLRCITTVLYHPGDIHREVSALDYTYGTINYQCTEVTNNNNNTPVPSKSIGEAYEEHRTTRSRRDGRSKYGHTMCVLGGMHTPPSFSARTSCARTGRSGCRVGNVIHEENRSELSLES